MPKIITAGLTQPHLSFTIGKLNNKNYMRNKYKGQCYVCGKNVEAGTGFFERFMGKFRVKHEYCKTEFKHSYQYLKNKIVCL
jgi:hypothetical protein